jgi:hypothetical protein
VSCDNGVALDALRRDHVRWEQLHARVRARLARAGYGPDSFADCRGRPELRRALQYGEKGRGGQTGAPT